METQAKSHPSKDLSATNRFVGRTYPINPHPEECPVQSTLDVISGKWKPLIMFHLMHGATRFGELLTAINGISRRMLSRQLRELEAKRLVTRTVLPEAPPHVEYELTKLGRDLDDVFATIAEWGVRFLAEQHDDRPEGDRSDA